MRDVFEILSLGYVLLAVAWADGPHNSRPTTIPPSWPQRVREKFMRIRPFVQTGALAELRRAVLLCRRLVFRSGPVRLSESPFRISPRQGRPSECSARHADTPSELRTGAAATFGAAVQTEVAQAELRRRTTAHRAPERRPGRAEFSAGRPARTSLWPARTLNRTRLARALAQLCETSAEQSGGTGCNPPALRGTGLRSRPAELRGRPAEFRTGPFKP